MKSNCTLQCSEIRAILKTSILLRVSIGLINILCQSSTTNKFQAERSGTFNCENYYANLKL